MNTAFILAIIVLGALSAALGAMLAAARREAGHLRADIIVWIRKRSEKNLPIMPMK